MNHKFVKKSCIVYCDAIAHTIRCALQQEANQKTTLIMGVGSVKSDLDEGGALVSTTKTINVVDLNGTLYEIKITAVSN